VAYLKLKSEQTSLSLIETASFLIVSSNISLLQDVRRAEIKKI